MPSINNGNDSEVDGDLSENESGSSHDAKADSSEADDDSSELDESECDRRTANYIKHMGDLEHQFTVLREQLYQERVRQIEMNLIELRNGRSQEYLEPLKQLTDAMERRVEVAGILRNYRLENVSHKFCAEEQGARQHFESEKSLAKDAIYEELMEKIRRLEEDRHNVDISWADWNKSSRSSKVRGPGRKKAITVSGPYIVLMLGDDQIMDDWRIIRKALKNTTSTTTTTTTTAT